MKLRAIFLLIPILLWACESENRPYLFPKTRLGEVPQPEHNIATEAGVELGEKLFFDPRLSANGKISCASCHFPDRAFTDGVALSRVGVSHKPLIRHAPALFNLAWTDGTFWDGGAKNLESQVFGPLTHPDEMAMDLTLMVRLLQEDAVYPGMFKRAWGTDSVSTMLIARSLAQFERTLISDFSQYDGHSANQTRPTLQWEQGQQAFQKNCASCHKEPLLTDNSYHNNGIDSAFNDRREEQILLGRYRITMDSADIGKFKTPSLRNLGFTAPYMHDGRFATLEDVIEHYSEGILASPNLAKKLPVGGLKLSKEEKASLLYFLLSANDSSFTRKTYKYNH